jgi:hypothetical protein
VAENIDRKSIEAHATDGNYIFALVVQKEPHQWMKEEDFDRTSTSSSEGKASTATFS